MKEEIKGIKNIKENRRNKNKFKNNQDKNKDLQKGKPEWIYVEPEASELTKPKKWNNSTWWWCGTKTGGKCEQYRCHKPKQCKGLAKSVQDRETTPDPEQAPPQKPPHKKRVHFEKEKKNSKQIKLSKALAKAAVADTVPNDDDFDNN